MSGNENRDNEIADLKARLAALEGEKAIQIPTEPFGASASPDKPKKRFVETPVGLAVMLLGVGMAALVVLSAISSEDPFAEAKALMRRTVASDVTLNFLDSTLRRYDRGAAGYNVCGQVTVNQPGLVNYRTERFVLPVASDGTGLATFDGGRNDDNDFNSMQQKFCTH